MVTDAYPPMRTSCAVQMYDLGQAFIEQGHQVTIVTPASALKEKIYISFKDGVRLVQVKAFETKDINYLYRTLAEFINPFLIWRQIKKSSEFMGEKYEGVIWYSPTIFWGPLIKRLKQQFNVKAYLILRDIFPDWALDLGLIKEGFTYRFLKAVEKFQYQQADIIGVQSPNNLSYFKEKNHKLKAKIEVLWNWIGKPNEIPCSIELSKTLLKEKKIFVYAGNMGVAQNMGLIIELAERLEKKINDNTGFLLIGRGSQIEILKKMTLDKKLSNVLFLDEIRPQEIQGLLKQCKIGLISLDLKHRHHNIPGKFLSYLSAGLPILASVNQGNDLIKVIRDNNIGYCIDDGDILTFENAALELLKAVEDKINSYESIESNLIKNFYSTDTVCKQISHKF